MLRDRFALPPDCRLMFPVSSRPLFEIWLLFLLILALSLRAAASDPLGGVNASSVSCASVMGSGGVPGGSCFVARVSCPEIADMAVPVKVNQPTGTPIGTILFTSGGGGTQWYDLQYTFGEQAIQQVLEAGYTVVQFKFDRPPMGFRNGKFDGWLTGPGGPRALACRWASLAQWAHDNLRATDTSPFCATGNSGGAAAAGYAVAFYGLGPIFNLLEETSGPAFTSVDGGCECNSAPVQTPCGQGTQSLCYLGDATKFIDPAYQNTSCSDAERLHRSPFHGRFIHDSLDATDASFRFPGTEIHIVLGGLDTGSAPPQAMLWRSLITGSSKPTVECVADAPHDLPSTQDGARKIAQDLIASCH